MSPQVSCASEAPVGAASTVSIGEHMVVPLSRNCRLRDSSSRFHQLSNHESGSRVHVWSYLTSREVEVKDASTAAVLFDSSLSIIDAICSQTRGSFSIS
jgi:hypothetical protein